MTEPSLKTASKEDGRTLKFNVPAELHTKLWSLRTLRGKPVAETLTEALEAYFELLKDDTDIKL